MGGWLIFLHAKLLDLPQIAVVATEDGKPLSELLVKKYFVCKTKKEKKWFSFLLSSSTSDESCD